MGNTYTGVRLGTLCPTTGETELVVAFNNRVEVRTV